MHNVTSTRMRGLLDAYVPEEARITTQNNANGEKQKLRAAVRVREAHEVRNLDDYYTKSA